MATSFSILVGDSGGWNKASLDEHVYLPASDPKGQYGALINYLSQLASGCGAAYLNISTSSGTLTAASGTVTLASVQVGDTVTLNGVAFTAVSGTAAANEFDMSGDNTADAASLAASISASVTALVSGYLTATSNLAVVTVSSLHKGILGNQATLASSNGGRLAVSGARLASGAGGFSTGVRAYVYGT